MYDKIQRINTIWPDIYLQGMLIVKAKMNKTVIH